MIDKVFQFHSTIKAQLQIIANEATELRSEVDSAAD